MAQLGPAGHVVMNIFIVPPRYAWDAGDTNVLAVLEIEGAHGDE